MILDACVSWVQYLQILCLVICYRSLQILKLFKVLHVFLLLMLPFLSDILFFSISVTAFQTSPRNCSVSLRSYVRVAVDIPDISHCLQSRLGFS